MSREKGKNVVEEMRQFFAGQERWISWDELARVFRMLTRSQLRKKLNYLVERGELEVTAHESIDDAHYRVLQRHLIGESENHGSIKPQRRAEIDEAVDKYIGSTTAGVVLESVPDDEPEGTFKIIGNLIDDFQLNHEFMGTVVRVNSPGFSDRPYLLKEL